MRSVAMLFFSLTLSITQLMCLTTNYTANFIILSPISAMYTPSPITLKQYCMVIWLTGFSWSFV